MVENVKELLKLHEGITHEVYLDNENSSIVPQEIVDEMLPYFNKKAYGNPTLTHKPGWEAFEVIMNCFQKVSKSIGAKNLEDITFTPGETEANNLASYNGLQVKVVGRKLCTLSRRQLCSRKNKSNHTCRRKSNTSPAVDG